MKCCTPHARSAGRLFSFFARSYRRRFGKKGFEASQKQLLEGIQQAGFHNMSILEIGCGVGHLHQTLLEQGASTACGIDLAPAMIAEARDWAKERGLAEKTRYLQGDFLYMTDEIETADLVVLDKVICCYPDANRLVHDSLDKTRQLYAFSIPRQRWYMKLGISIGAFLMKLVFSDFRPYLHDPEQIDAWVIGQGFEKVYENNTFSWLIRVYSKM